MNGSVCHRNVRGNGADWSGVGMERRRLIEGVKKGEVLVGGVGKGKGLGK